MKAFIIILIMIFGVFLCSAQNYPNPVGYVNDFANILSKSEKDTLNAKLSRFENETSIEIAVVTVTSLQGYSIERFTLGLANAWGVGKKSTNNGVVLLIAPNERMVRIEAGTGLMNKLTDSASREIIQEVIIPEIKSKRMNSGIINGIDAIVAVFNPQSITRIVNTKQQQKLEEINQKQIEKFGLVFFFTILICVTIFLIVVFVSNRYEFKKEAIVNLYNAKVALEKLRPEFLGSKGIVDDLENILKWDLSRMRVGFYQIDISEIDSMILEVEYCLKKLFLPKTEISNLLKKIQNQIDRIDTAIRCISTLRFLPDEVSSIEEEIKNDPDVKMETKAKLTMVLTHFKNLCGLIYEHGLMFFEIVCPQVKQVADSLERVKAEIVRDKEFAKKAREEGPNMLKSIQLKLEEARKNVSDKKKRKALDQAYGNYRKAINMSRQNNPNWITIFTVLMLIDSLCDNVNSESHSSISSSHYSSRDDTNSSSSISSFGGFGGGSFSGGGASGGW